MKIVIIGYSGSGKSTLAENLARYYSIPKLHMDTLQFQPGWIDSDRDWMDSFSAIIETGSLMAITLGAAMRKEWSKPTRLSFSTSLVGTASLEPGNDTAVIKAESVRVWRQVAPNALTGNSSVGSFGTVAKLDRSHAIRLSAKTIQTNFSLSRIKKSWMSF